MKQTYPLNPISEITKERCLQFQNKIDSLGKGGICSKPRSRSNNSIPAPISDAPNGNVIGEICSSEDENGDLKPGLKFKCKANQKNVLYVNSETPAYGKVFFGKYGKIKFTLGNNDFYYQTPEKIIFYAGDDIFNTVENGSFLTGEIKHPTEFWLYVEEEPLILKDNKGDFEFILFFYSEQDSKYVLSKISDLLKQ
jgi:hypothetical protein